MAKPSKSSRSKAQMPLFGDDAPIPADVSSAVRLQVALDQTPSESAAHKRLRTAMQEVSRLTERLSTVQALADAHRAECARVLLPLETAMVNAVRELALWLDQRLTRPGLGKRQRFSMTELIMDVTDLAYYSGDETVFALYKKHADILDRAMGGTAMDTPPGGGFDGSGDDDWASMSFDEMAAHLDAMMQAEMDRVRAQSSQPRKAKKPSAAAQRKAQEAAELAQDANQALRTIYRQLASALHPDREADPVLAAQKTALMKDVNVAYAARDLPTLLQLMLKADLIDLQGMADLAESRARALDALFDEQRATLMTQVSDLEDQVRAEFGLSRFQQVNAKTLHKWLGEQREHLQNNTFVLQEDLRTVTTDDAAFKRWFKARVAKMARDLDF